MAFAACLVARKTLGSFVVSKRWVGRDVDGVYAGAGEGVNGSKVPQDVCPQRLHELLAFDVHEDFRLPDDPRVREHDVQSAVFRHRLVHHAFHVGLVRGVEVPGVDVDVRVEGFQLALVRRQVLVRVVADVDGSGAVVGELVGGGAADADWGVGSFYEKSGWVG